MIIAKTRQELARVVQGFQDENLKTGLVPTMGALHVGHRSLLQRSAADNQKTICSIFVNPTQFTDAVDLERYPRPVVRDIELLEAGGVDVLFMPPVSEIYPHEEHWELDLEGLDKVLEGKSRPGHFQGVTQIVSKLFDLVKPARAYFGQKDYQQFAVISRMVSLMNYPIQLVRCPIVREADGLAMSSRNIHLNQLERQDAGLISKALFRAAEIIEAGALSPEEICQEARQLIAGGHSLKTDYFCIADAATLKPLNSWDGSTFAVILAAVWAGSTRLIDNLVCEPGGALKNS